MPVLLAPAFALFVGAAFAWLGSDRHAADRARERRAIQVALGFGGLVLAPALAWFLAFYGDWSYLYLLPAERVPSAVDAVLVLAVALAVPGATWGLVGRQGRLAGAVPRVTVATGAALVLLAGLLWRRLAVSATYAQFHGDFGRSRLAGSPLGATVVLAGLAFAAAAAHGARVIRPDLVEGARALLRRPERPR